MLVGSQGVRGYTERLLLNRSVMSDSLQPHGLQHTRLPCPSPPPRVCSNSCPFESVMPSNHLILCRPHLLLPSILPSIREGIRKPPSLAPWGGEGCTPAHTHAHTCAHKHIQESSCSLPDIEPGGRAVISSLSGKRTWEQKYST